MLSVYYRKHGVEPDYEVFRSKGFSPEWGTEAPHRSINMAALPPFLRTLLVTDGTVTKALEAYYWEPILVDAVFQAFVCAEEGIDWLDVREGEEVLSRRVNLRGRHSPTVYAKAFSIICSSLIPDRLRSQLLAGRLGIGELIRDCGLETYRELLEIGLTTADDELDAGDAQLGTVYRTYRIVLGGKPTILVTEHFPLDVFRPSHG